MSIKQLQGEVTRFLASSEPEVICIKGKWGVGKTFAWNHFLNSATQQQQLGMNTYAYVSLFGLNNLQEVRYALFENTISTQHLQTGPNEWSLEQNLNWVKKHFRRLPGIFRNVPIVKDYFTTAESRLFFLVKDQLVCIDDLERAGAGLRIADIMGLVSFLKEQRRCKVMILLNQEELSDSDREVFDKQLEKVADLVLDFSPSPQEVAEIAFPKKQGIEKLISDNCISLGIVNIRVLKKIERFCLRINEILEREYPELILQAIHTATLFTWAVYQPKEAPPVSFLKKLTAAKGFTLNRAQISEEERPWLTLLKHYRYYSTDDLDREILSGIESGFFDSAKLQLLARREQMAIQDKQDDRAFHEAWEAYHDSFKNDEDEVIEKIYQTALAALGHIHPANLNSSVVLLKKCGKPHQATMLIRKFVEARPEVMGKYDSWERSFWDITDQDLIDAFKKLKVVEKKKDYAEILSAIATQKLFENEQLEDLSKVSTDEFYKIFKDSTGDLKNDLVKGTIFLHGALDTTGFAKSIADRAIAALSKIAAESPLNAMRVTQLKVPGLIEVENAKAGSE